MNKRYEKELDLFSNDKIFNKLNQESVFFISGSTGMIGSYLVDLLMYLNNAKGYKIQIYAMGRSKESASKRFKTHFDNVNFHFVEGDVTKTIVSDVKADYVVHAASNSDPKLYATQPVETLNGNFLGMLHLLNYAKEVNAKRVIYISSGEMYGIPFDIDDFDGFVETDSGYVDYSKSRACYPSGKRAAEVLCQSYLDEYNIDSVILRPCHIYGPTMTNSDTRAISSFIRDGVFQRDIVLKSKGDQIRSHCYVGDMAMAIVYAIINGQTGEAYNVAGDSSIAAIKDLASIICNYANTEITFDIPSETEQKGFSKVPAAILKNNKLKSIGWQSHYSLNSGIEQTINILRENIDTNNQT
ncbi:NAD-dependent epimerase/dehydratase family protein [Breznakia pachnodae]|uniref:Nucleoside-diphosphate-sugar epimerase n=1 Tax=Breznakia pachnodae TaxID=265178 RepID=A0ABU0DYS0_9FIRM|nr:NAD-dependent epimerase/dehydratase family protein [Breznakia pachnodae]MDQ0359787.1 nucleoside-diphosphate-sugar epimerase [Breznakia pachnodae]